MVSNVIIINCSGSVGKDCFIDFCREFVSVTNVSSVDKIKEAANILGWRWTKEEEDRLFLSNLKILSTGYNNNPYEYIKESIIEFRKGQAPLRVMFIHIREPLEIDKVKRAFECSTLLIKNINKPKIMSNMADANVENYKYDYTINNDGDLNNLKEQAQIFMKEVL